MADAVAAPVPGDQAMSAHATAAEQTSTSSSDMRHLQEQLRECQQLLEQQRAVTAQLQRDMIVACSKAEAAEQQLQETQARLTRTNQAVLAQETSLQEHTRVLELLRMKLQHAAELHAAAGHLLREGVQDITLRLPEAALRAATATQRQMATAAAAAAAAAAVVPGLAATAGGAGQQQGGGHAAGRLARPMAAAASSSTSAQATDLGASAAQPAAAAPVPGWPVTDPLAIAPLAAGVLVPSSSSQQQQPDAAGTAAGLAASAASQEAQAGDAAANGPHPPPAASAEQLQGTGLHAIQGHAAGDASCKRERAIESLLSGAAVPKRPRSFAPPVSTTTPATAVAAAHTAAAASRAAPAAEATAAAGMPAAGASPDPLLRLAHIAEQQQQRQQGHHSNVQAAEGAAAADQAGLASGPAGTSASEAAAAAAAESRDGPSEQPALSAILPHSILLSGAQGASILTASGATSGALLLSADGPLGMLDANRRGLYDAGALNLARQLPLGSWAAIGMPCQGLGGMAAPAAKDKPAKKSSWFRQEIDERIPAHVQSACQAEWQQHGQVRVVCSDLYGTFFVNSAGEFQIRMLGNSEVVSPNKFEELAGKKTARNWQQSIRLPDFRMTGDLNSALMKLGHFTRIVGLVTDKAY